jgi:hypothetical protein
MVGYVALWQLDGVWSLHCVIDETQRRKGVATEACGAMILWSRKNGLPVIAEPLDKPESRALVARLATTGAVYEDPSMPGCWLVA